MPLRDDADLGNIRWSSEVFSEPPPTSGKSRGLIWVSIVVIVLVIVLLITTFKSVSDAPNGLIQAPAMPAPSETTALAPTKVHQKLREPMPPVAGFPIVPADAHGVVMLDEDFVLGVEIAGASRAYAINSMGKPESELLNDTLAGQPIAVTFCGACQSPLVFSRRVEGKTLTLHISGELLSDNMIMRDVETDSNWLQLTGEAIDGPLKGHQLEQIPVVWTDWKTWRERHPDTTLPELPNVVQNYRHHELYSAFPLERSFFSGLQWGLARGPKARSWPYAQLKCQPVVNDVFAGQPLLIVFDQRTSTVRAYNRRAGDIELTFGWQADHLTDDQTSSTWDPITGLAVKGLLERRQLTPVAGTVSLDWAWRSFHPESEMWSAQSLPTR
jgi:hypothetical protein